MTKQEDGTIGIFVFAVVLVVLLLLGAEYLVLSNHTKYKATVIYKAYRPASYRTSASWVLVCESDDLMVDVDVDVDHSVFSRVMMGEVVTVEIVQGRVTGIKYSIKFVEELP